MDVLCDLWTELESLIQFTSISTIIHIYYRWKWYKKQAKVVAKAQFDKELINRICASNRNVDNKCVLVNAKVSRIENNFAELLVNIQQHQHEFTLTNRLSQEKFLW